MKTFSNFDSIRHYLISKTGIFCSFILAATSLFSHQAYALDVECQIPLAIECHISDPKGFMSVTVTSDFGYLGTIEVASNSYPQCRTDAVVGWDVIVPSFQITTTPCGVAKLRLGSSDDGKRMKALRYSGSAVKNVAKPIENRFAEPRTQAFSIGVPQLRMNGGTTASVKYCDNHRVADDITACDIGEIAWACPDGASGPSEDCEADVNGLFD